MVVRDERPKRLPLRRRHPCDGGGRVEGNHQLVLVHLPSVSQYLLFRDGNKKGGGRAGPGPGAGAGVGFFVSRDNQSCISLATSIVMLPATLSPVNRLRPLNTSNGGRNQPTDLPLRGWTKRLQPSRTCSRWRRARPRRRCTLKSPPRKARSPR